MIRSLLVIGLLTLAFSGCNSQMEPEDIEAPIEIDYRADGEPHVDGPDAAPGAKL